MDVDINSKINANCISNRLILSILNGPHFHNLKERHFCVIATELPHFEITKGLNQYIYNLHTEVKVIRKIEHVILSIDECIFT